MTGGWVVIPNWERFQHYRDRDPPWIKLHRGLAGDPDWWVLSGHRRAVLVGIWLEYASTHGRLTFDARSISRRLNLRVTTADLESLVHAGFVEVSASRPLAPRYQNARPEGEGEREKTQAVTSTRDPDGDDVQANGNGPGFQIPDNLIRGVDDDW